MATLKQSTAYTRTFLMVSSADHVTGLTGATVTVNLSKAGATGAAAAGAVSEVDSSHNPGLYKVALTTADTGTLGDLAYHCTASSGDPTDFVDQVFGQAFDDLLGAIDTLTELAQAAPPTNPTGAQALMLLYMALRNLRSDTSSQMNITNNAGTTICKAALTDDGTTFSKAQLATGP